MGCKYIYIYIYIIGERETKRKRGKKDGREERETKFFIFCDCVIYIILFYWVVCKNKNWKVECIIK